MKKITAILAVIMLCLGFASCSNGAEKERPYETKIFNMKEVCSSDFFRAYAHSWVTYQQTWGQVLSTDNYDTALQTDDFYKEFQFYVLDNFKTNDYRLRAVMFTVKTEKDCNMNFSVNNELFNVEKLNNRLIAGTEHEIVVDINQLMGDIMTKSTKPNPGEFGFNIGTYLLEEMQNVDKNQPYSCYREIKGVPCNVKVESINPEIRINIKNIKLSIDVFQKG